MWAGCGDFPTYEHRQITTSHRHINTSRDRYMRAGSRNLERRLYTASSLREPRSEILPRDAVGEQAVERAGPVCLDGDEVLDAFRKVTRVGVDAPEHDLIAEHQQLVDP